MPTIEYSPEQREYERQVEVEDRDYYAAVERSRVEAKYKHELEVAKAKLAVPQRHKTITRVFLAIAKSPALLVLAIMLPIITLKGKELPESLAKFIEL